MISTIQQVSSAICLEELFSAAIDHSLTPIEFRVYCQILYNAQPQKVGGLCTQTVLALSTRTKIEINQVEIALLSLINSQLIIRHELSGIKRISYELTEPERWIASTPVMPVSEIKTDRFFGETSRHPNFVFSPQETPWLNPPRNRRDINFKPEFVDFHAKRFQASKPGFSFFDAKEIIKGYFLKNPDAIILKWDSYQEWLEEENKKVDQGKADFKPMKLTLDEHKELIAQKKELGDEAFASLGKKEKNYLDWSRQKPAEFKFVVSEINKINRSK